MGNEKLLNKEVEYHQIDQIYDECINYLKTVKDPINEDNYYKLKTSDKYIDNRYDIGHDEDYDPSYQTIEEVQNEIKADSQHPTDINKVDYYNESDVKLQYENETKSTESITSLPSNLKSERLRRLSRQLPKIIVTQSATSLSFLAKDEAQEHKEIQPRTPKRRENIARNVPVRRPGQDFPKRLVSKSGMENVVLISNVPFEKIRLLNDTFHTLINLRWRWIVTGTIVVHFSIWLIFAAFWYISALAHYDFEPDPPAHSCVTGGHDFLTIFLASVEAQTTIGFGDRTIDEECPESIFLFIMQLILGTGLSGVLTCVVYAKLTRPEKLSRDGVGFSRRAVISVRDGHLCLMIRAWDLNYDHIISSEFTAHFVNTHRTNEGEVIRYYARSLKLEHRQFLLWPVTLVHVIDSTSPLYHITPDLVQSSSFEITVTLKGASASMGTFTQSQTSYLPKEILWGYRFPPVVKYNRRKQKYVIEHKKLNLVEPAESPSCSAHQMYSLFREESPAPPQTPGTPSTFSDTMSAFQLQRSSSFRKKDVKD